MGNRIKKFFITLISLMTLLAVAGCGSINTGGASASNVKGKVYTFAEITVSYSAGFPEELKYGEETIAALEAESEGRSVAFSNDYKYFDLDKNGNVEDYGTWLQRGSVVTVSSTEGSMQGKATDGIFCLEEWLSFGDYAITITIKFNYSGKYNGNNGGGSGGGGGEVEEEEGVFKVTLECNGASFIPETEMYAVWTASDGSGITQAQFGEDGIAKTEELDGNYSVTLLGVPEGYTYNPNVYSVSNSKRNIAIQLYELIPTVGSGADKYNNIIKLSKLGAYRINFTEAGQEIFCQYQPSKNGEYVVESIMSVVDNEINPRLNVYVGTSAWKPSTPTETINEGGVCSAYTKNVKYVIQMTSNERGNVYAFGLKCDSRVGYPAYVDFIITRDGDFERDEEEIPWAVPTENFRNPDGTLKQHPSYSGYNFLRFGIDDDPNGVCDGGRVAYYDPAEGGDGYYHLVDGDGNITDTLLYARLKDTNTDSGLSINLYGDELVSLKVNNVNYTFFIRGYDYLVNNGYSNASEFEGKLGYGDCLLNYGSYGLYPVTKELKDFLQAFCLKNQYFMDGYGWAEQNGYNSTLDNSWLCFTGYFTR